ncbi:MAG: hypothetical protein A3H72_03940 [Candidatus Doudnabacteria bacterium RIFCSPLOWO2_02_FULL_48_8]|uniref:Uncharacterized protein n=1 Tax=Candidatus Doudnabacteria bacterium RIFCSPHIGHO2_01_FULL_46_24 TaxID=1817825 RepID=A0A1F5NVJ8_9BACT|nr:MAG: hypothetical protein A2720_02150 [Candidatus Doudnabacteria bacterium RIFCSPHIGHO2_01_FULL_46_24]OGE95149.1 MAG: hypothetical protein A3H72_03940 [Candidatus Doudnabacteria bacterium RIFCSPLOWO2_02_FULL_48_8]OGE95532.1 MAG: hypothetical protein A3E98_01830 [Candidatus Doudnabacteria bacterium RIFCSPHIGHO2_12_FULL_48_11]
MKNKNLIIVFFIFNIVLSWLMLSNVKVGNIYALDYKDILTWLILISALIPGYILVKASKIFPEKNVRWITISISSIVVVIIWFYFLRTFQGLF